jgi:hypothetical protein
VGITKDPVVVGVGTPLLGSIATNPRKINAGLEHRNISAYQPSNQAATALMELGL